MQSSKAPWFPVVLGVIVLVAIIAPYIYAANAGGDEYVFGGFLLNPLDNNTYLAKMYQGWEGDWRYRLAFTADPGEGAYLHLFYLFLGHCARLLGLPLIWIFHIARLLSAMVLLWVLWRFFCELFPDQRSQKLAFTLAALGSGLGWVLVPFGVISSDLWVAEIYPFLSAFTNPHFPLGLALMLGLTMPEQIERTWRGKIVRICLAWLLSVVSPFGLVVVLGILGGQYAIMMLGRQAWKDIKLVRRESTPILLTLIGGSPMIFYDLWVVRAYPTFAAWNAQNLTPSPPVWDLLVSLSPALILAFVGAWQTVLSERLIFRRKRQSFQSESNLLIWVGLVLILVYLPFGLQRRFLVGLFIPLAGLAALGIKYLAARFSWSYRFWAVFLIVLSIPTNLMVLLTTFHGVRTQQPLLYLTQEEAFALKWIAENTSSDVLVLASPELGNFIPAHTGRRVIYGHPFETVNAVQEEQVVEQFFGGAMPLNERQFFLASRGIDYIICGPRERDIGDRCMDWGYEPIFSQGPVAILLVEE